MRPYERPRPSSDTLRVPLVGGLAGTGRAASGTRPSATAALSVQRGAGGAGVRRVPRVAAGAAAAPDRRAGEGEGLDSVVDTHSGIGIGGLVGAGELD